MKPLVTNRRMLTWVCGCPLEEGTSKVEKIVQIVVGIVIFATISFTLSINLFYFFEFVANAVEEALHVAYIFSAWFPAWNGIVVAFLSRNKVSIMFGKLSEIYDANKDEASFRFLAQANNKSERICQIYTKYLLIVYLITLLVLATTSVLMCFIIKGDFDVNYAFHPAKYFLPWDQETLVGYIGELVFQLLIAEVFFAAYGSLILLYVSIYLHCNAFRKMFHYSVGKLEHQNERHNQREAICKIIDFHNTVKDWFSLSVSIYSPITLVQMIGSILMSACIIFRSYMQLQHSDVNVGNVFELIVGILISTSFFFVYCYFGKQATDSYSKMSDCLYEANWHELPIDLQKNFVIMIGNAQRPLFFHGFQMVEMNLETFCVFAKKVYSYYMIFKTVITD